MPSEIADILERVRQVAVEGVVRSADLERKDREKLQKAGWLRRIIRGWYLLLQPTDTKGTTTAWYASFWSFVALYLQERLGSDYCLSAETSIDLHLGPTQVPRQLVVITARGGSNVVELPEQKSILTYQQADTLPPPEHVQTLRGVRVMSLPLALARISAAFFERQPRDAEIAIRMLGDPSELVRVLLSGRYVSASERLAGAYDFLGEEERSQRIQSALVAAGNRIKPKNPFEVERPVFGAGTRVRSPYGARVRMLWETMRDPTLESFDLRSKPIADFDRLLERVEATQVEDAYHSLSIEGYRVTPDLIARIREGRWDPESETDRPERNALAAKGYNEAFKLVSDVIRQSLETGAGPQAVTDAIQSWYAALFSPSVTAGLVNASDLAGYRGGPVYIRGAQHVPPPNTALPDAMDAYTECYQAESSPVVRALLGHFVFVWIHPFPDGNGRVARFIMNATLVTAGYPWTIIRVENRETYMAALEDASSNANIRPFTQHVAMEARESLKHWQAK